MTTNDIGTKEPGHKIHPLPLRILHWINAVAILLMIGSGWTIYNGNPIFSWLKFPQLLSLGGDPAIAFKHHGDGGFGGGTEWHFAAMWLLMLSGIAYLIYGFATGRFRSKFLPIRPKEVVIELRKALRFNLSHADINVYNAVQKMLYIGVISAVIIQVAAGLALWKSIQFSGLVWLFGGFQGVRLVHFLGMSAICGFIAIHVLLALIVPRTLVAMVTGGPDVDRQRDTRKPAATLIGSSGAPS